jgi:N-methylhydantoinase B
VVESADYAADSAGAGRFRGGPGIDFAVTALRDMDLTVVNERSQVPPFALAGGGGGRCNQVLVHTPDGTVEQHTKVTSLHVPAGSRIEVRTGGGAGYGPPEQRSAGDVYADIDAGYLTEAGARAQYPHVF